MSGEPKSQSHILFIQNLGWISCLVALAVCIFRMRTVYLNAEPFFRRPKIAEALGRLGVRQVSFPTCRSLDLSYYFAQHSLDGVALETLLAGKDALDPFGAFFPGVSSPGRKIATILRSQAAAEMWDIDLVLCWASSQDEASRIILWGFPSPYVTEALRKSGERVSLFFPAWIWPFWISAELIGKGIRKGGRKMLRLVQGLLTSASKSDQTDKGLKTPVLPTPDPAVFEILYFPHQSIFYGNLYVKDQFYSQDSASPLHPSRILHIETGPLDPSLEKKMLRCYQERNIPSMQFGQLGAKSIMLSVLSYAWGLIKKPKLLIRAGKKHRLFLLAQICFAFIRFNHYRKCLEGLKRAEIALVGYDFLFPKTLAAALESRNIRTIACQERYSLLFYPHMGLIMDTWLGAGTESSRLIAANAYRNVRKVEEVGLVRSDMLLEYRRGDDPDVRRFQEAAGSRKLVTVYDFHSLPGDYSNNLQPVVNWQANREFYQDILKLADDFSDAFFVIRGKNDSWCSIPAFEDVYNLVLQHPRIDICRNYSSFGQSYKLAAISDLVIAKYTSLGEECLSAGIPVLFHDYQHNARTIFSEIYDYGGKPVYVHSYEELKKRVGDVLIRGEYLPKDQLSQLMKNMFGGEADGRACERVREYVEQVYASLVSPGVQDNV